ncbi:MAG: putative metal-binding motif-containing protein [Myxococcales bacterium]|nr:putative metal-binding motif-containing protein [Myxococcales bacterium]
MNPSLRLTAALLLVSCSSSPPSSTCQSHLDCPTGQVCEGGACVAPSTTTDCTDGQTRPCGPDAVGACRKGTQRCVGGHFESTCTGAVQPSTEVCNAVDDDCDGEVDEGVGRTFTVDADGDGFGSNAPGAQTRVGCAAPQGFVDDRSDCDDARAQVNPSAAEVCDASGADEDCDGTANEGCSCTPGASQPCCAGRGTQTCEVVDGGTALSTCSVQPQAEVCNGVDDDCNGQPDDGATTVTGDGGVGVLDGGVANPDGTCTMGVGVCAMLGSTVCSAGTLSCTAVPGMSSAETCNTLDDDCDGQVDEAGAGLCPATGQACTSGACQCPGGQSVCNGACVALSAEVCDGVDNDCDGQVDETLTIACNADADGDGYADGTTTSQQCPNVARPQAGNCPVGFVAPAASLGADCDALNGSRYRLVSSRGDADTDGYCAGPASNDCVGTTALAGRRFVTACAATEDCNDSSASSWQLLSSRTDADGDTVCVGGASMDCVGSTPLPGRRFAASCNAVGEDCNDASLSLYRLMQTRADSDNDTYCTGATVNECVGVAAPSGRRFSANCQTPDDCNDTNGGLFRLAAVRSDGDGDTWCAGAAVTQCIGSSPSAGQRLAISCAGDDCRDTNSAATSTCVLPGAYTTVSHAQTCPNGPQNFTLITSTFCPAGFSLSSYSAQILSGLGNCTATSANTITQSCNFLEGTNCRVVGTCTAN